MEIDLDGGVFVQIFPDFRTENRYNYWIFQGNDMGPFPISTPVFSGEIVWERVIFDLHPFRGRDARFRFRFGSNSTGVREGWYIDDVEVTYQAPISMPTNFSGSLVDSVTVRLEWNSPSGSSLESGGNPGKGGDRNIDALEYYRVYRNNELIADNVQALFYEDDMRPLPSATYSYQVTAVYTKGESQKTVPVDIEYQSTGVEGAPVAEVPEEYYLKPNFPNPFNPTTTISFGLPEPAEVKLAVYDLLGRETAVLVEEAMPAGNHSAVWNAENLPSGIYFYRMNAGDFKAMGKMLLVK